MPRRAAYLLPLVLVLTSTAVTGQASNGYLVAGIGSGAGKTTYPEALGGEWVWHKRIGIGGGLNW